MKTWQHSLLLLLSFVPACGTGGGDDGAASPGDIASSIEDAIARGGAAGVPPAEYDARSVGPSTTTVDTYADGTSWDCTVQKMSIQQNPDEFVALQPTTGVIYPGALLQGASLLSEDPRPIGVKRGGGRIVYDVVVGGGARDVQKDLDEVTFGNVVQAQDDLLTQLNDTNAAVPARLSTSVDVFDSTEEMAAALHLSTKLFGAKLKASLELSKEKRVSRVVGQLTQTYFTVKFERPAKADDFFAPGTKPADVQPFVGKGNPATYVDSVTYGRRAYFVVESESSKQDLKAAVEAKFAGTSIEGKLELKNAVSSASLRFVALGGPSAAILSAIASASNSAGSTTPASQTIDPSGDGKPLVIAPTESEGPLDTFRRYLGNQDAWVFSKANPPVPISYVVRNVLDDTIVKMDAGTEFEKRSCSPRIGPTKTGLVLDATRATFAPGGNLASWPSSTDARGPMDLGRAGTLTRGDLNGRAAISFNDGDAGAKGMDCGFLVDHDYAMAFVLRSRRVRGTQEMFFTSGYDDGRTGNYLHFGWSADGGDKLSLGHLVADTAFAYNGTGEGAVLFVNYRKNEGFSAWANGVALTPNGGSGDPAATPFRGASACAVGTTQFDGRSGYPSVVQSLVGEVRGYRAALGDSERQVVECELAAKWGLPMGARCFDGKPVSAY